MPLNLREHMALYKSYFLFDLVQPSVPQFKKWKAAYPDHVVQRTDKVILDVNNQKQIVEINFA